MEDSLPEFCMSLQVGCFCSLPNLHLSRGLIVCYQERQRHVGKARTCIDSTNGSNVMLG